LSITKLSAPLARSAAVTERAGAAATARLSSGLRVADAADDAAGLSVAERLRARYRGAEAASRNVTDAINLLQTADAALGEMNEILQRTRELAVAYRSDALSEDDRGALEEEAGALGDELARLYGATAYNGQALLQGDTLSWQVGSKDVDTIVSALPDLGAVLELDPFTLGASTTTTSGGQPGGRATGWWRRNSATATTTTTITTMNENPIERVDQAIDLVSGARGALGALQNRFEYRLSVLSAVSESHQAAESRIRDADVAADVVTLTRTMIQRRAQQALLAQATGVDRDRVLSLLAA